MINPCLEWDVKMSSATRLWLACILMMIFSYVPDVTNWYFPNNAYNVMEGYLESQIFPNGSSNESNINCFNLDFGVFILEGFQATIRIRYKYILCGHCTLTKWWLVDCWFVPSCLGSWRDWVEKAVWHWLLCFAASPLTCCRLWLT